jgi:hypothetical protein
VEEVKSRVQPLPSGVGQPSVSDSHSDDLKNDIKGIIRPRAKIVDEHKLYLLCPVDGTLTEEAAISFPYNGKNYWIKCRTCGQSYYIAMNYRIRGAKETLDEVVARMEAA